ncbi:MAG: class I SAM-dependent methyltransferase [Actinobacteria bacterium]|nr:class I SAM-dependent methyltransferase [Actinomycetota bacterium]
MSTTPPRADRALVAALRADLVAADFTVSGVGELLGPMAGAALLRDHLLPAQRVTAADDSPRSSLVRLFSLGDPVDLAEAERALPTLGVDGAAHLGLVAFEGDAVVALVDVRPYAADGIDHWIASDLGELATGRPLLPDHVLGFGGASATLASWTPRPQVRRALDLGTGCGVQALHLMPHAEEVVVTDLSERALGFARFNALLNDADWDVRAGSLLAPVAGELFDLIVSNPPFVITPRGGEVPLFEYRDGGASGDAIVAGLVRTIGAHLVPGGIAQFLGNWEVRVGQDWQDRLREWLEGTGLDAWIVQREMQDPAEYAETWARDGGHHPGTADFDRMYAAWLDDFASREVAAIGFGVITLHRPMHERAPFVDLVDLRQPVAGGLGESIRAGIAARVWLAEHTDEEVLDLAWRAADDVHESRHRRPGADDPSRILWHQGSGLRRQVELTTVTAAYASVCDGELTAGVAASAIAGLLGADDAAVRAEVVAFIRDVARDGLLLLPAT